MFDWDDLRVFLAVARAKRFAAAARVLGIDATTVTRRLRRLSDQLDVTLFETVGTEHHLTERGRALLDHAEAVEGLAINAVRDVGGETHSLSGQVRLSAPEGFASWVIAPALPRFHAAHTQIELEVITASGFLNPSRRQADMAVMLARPRSGRLVVVKLADYCLNLYAASDYLAQRSEPQKIDDLKNHCLIGYIPELVDSPELDYLDEIGSGLNTNLRSTSITVQHRMIAAGGGIGLLPAFIGSRDASLRPVLAEHIVLKRSFWLVTHADRREVSRIKVVKQFLHSVIAADDRFA